jgi:hypothetical protein
MIVLSLTICVADPGSGGFLTPGSAGWVKIRIGIRDEHPGSYFREQINNFIVKILKFFYVDPGPGPGIFLTLDPGSGLEKSLLGEANQEDRDEKEVATLLRKEKTVF